MGLREEGRLAAVMAARERARRTRHCWRWVGAGKVVGYEGRAAWFVTGLRGMVQQPCWERHSGWRGIWRSELVRGVLRFWKVLELSTAADKATGLAANMKVPFWRRVLLGWETYITTAVSGTYTYCGSGSLTWHEHPCYESLYKAARWRTGARSSSLARWRSSQAGPTRSASTRQPWDIPWWETPCTAWEGCPR